MGPWPRTFVAILLGTVLVSGAPARATPEASPSSTPEPSFLSRHRRTLLIATGSGAVACGIAAIASRNAANDRYEEYQSTADPERIPDLYRETERLDNRAAALFISSEALFLATLYLGFFVPSPHEDLNAALELPAAAKGSSPTRPGPRSIPDLVPAHRGLALRWRF